MYQVGDKKGRLTILEFLPNTDEASKRLIRCLCDCGKEKTIRFNNFKYKTSSCGCLKADLIFERFSKDDKYMAIKQLLSHKIKDCKERNLKFELTESEFEELIFSNCYYCGVGPSNIYKRRLTHRIRLIKWNGIDRLDNTVHYTPTNCVPCCFDCNKMKHTKTYKEFKDKIYNLYNLFVKKDS